MSKNIPPEGLAVIWKEIIIARIAQLPVFHPAAAQQNMQFIPRTENLVDLFFHCCFVLRIQ